jgi:hypothetical protein
VARSERRIGETGHGDVDRFLDLVRDQLRPALGSELLGMYVGGSLALGAFDRASDVDVLIATTADLSQRFATLDALHRRLAREKLWFATELECIYMAPAGLRRFERAHARHLKLDRGAGEALKIDTMDESWTVYCHVLRTDGITWDGPDPATLIDDVTRADLRAAMHAILEGWASNLLRRPDDLRAPGYQSYTVLSLCRILYTLDEGTVQSKAAAAAWAGRTLPDNWHGLIARAVADRLRDRVRASDAAVLQTLGMIEFARARAGAPTRLANANTEAVKGAIDRSNERCS